MNFKTHHKLLLAIVIIVAAVYSANIGLPFRNEDLAKTPTHSVYIGDGRSQVVICGTIPFETFGLPMNGQSCASTDDCINNWPAGPSYAIRDREGACCTMLGECGRFEEMGVPISIA